VAENLTPSAQLPTQKTKQRRWGNFTQEPPLQLQSNEKRKVRRSVGKPFLVWGVCNCRDFVSAKRQKNCRASPGQCLYYLCYLSHHCTCFSRVGCALELGRLASGNPSPFCPDTLSSLSLSCVLWGVGLCLNVLPNA
jgi:hypothetical protein